jgi:hypothetical protein
LIGSVASTSATVAEVEHDATHAATFTGEVLYQLFCSGRVRKAIRLGHVARDANG